MAWLLNVPFHLGIKKEWRIFLFSIVTSSNVWSHSMLLTAFFHPLAPSKSGVNILTKTKLFPLATFLPCTLVSQIKEILRDAEKSGEFVSKVKVPFSTQWNSWTPKQIRIGVPGLSNTGSNGFMQMRSFIFWAPNSDWIFGLTPAYFEANSDDFH